MAPVPSGAASITFEFTVYAICVPLAETYPLERAPDAYDRFTAGGKFGKVVLVMFT